MLTLLEREAELSAIRERIERAAVGSGGLVTIDGPPGIGKTQLLQAARRFASDAGATVLAAGGSPFERGLPYATIRQAFAGPELSDVTLTSLAAAAREVLEPSSATAREERTLLVVDALYRATVDLCERRPLVLTIDDGQWVDPPSLRFLSYLARRLDGLPALVFYAHRSSGAGLGAELHESFWAGVDPLSLSLEPLGREATAKLVRAALGGADEDFCDGCYRSSGGNPLLIRELLRALAARGFEPSSEGLTTLEEIGPAAVAQTVNVRLGQLRPEARRLAEAVVVAGERAPLKLAADLAGLDEEETREAATELHRAEILAPAGSVEFVHPLIRDALAAKIEPLAAADAHRRAAALLRDRRAPAEAVASHLLHVEAGGEPWRVEILREAAAHAGDAGDEDTAIAYLRRALDEPPPEELRATILIELATAEYGIDGEAADAHLEEALPLIRDERVRVTTEARLAAMRPGSAPSATMSRALAAIAELGEEDHALRLQLLALVDTAAMLAPEPAEPPADVLREMRAEARSGGPGARALVASLGYRDAWANVPAAEILRRVEPAFSGEWTTSLEIEGGPLAVGFLALLAADSRITARVADEWIREGRRSGRHAALGGAKMLSAFAHLLRGALEEARAEAEESLEICAGWGMRGVPVAHAAAAACGAALAQGDREGARRALERADCSDAEAGSVGLHGLLACRAELRAADGETRIALTELLEVGERFERLGGRNPALLPWRSRAATLMVELDEDRDRAKRLLREELELAHEWGTPRAIGRTLTAMALLAAGEERIELLARALNALEPAPAPLERATALIALGGALHAERSPTEAREPLRQALETAAECGAEPLVERARGALFAAGGRPRRDAIRGPRALTRRERRVAELALAGRTNKEIAEDLYLVPRTVEGHLSNAYRKLGIKSRTELATALTEPG